MRRFNVNQNHSNSRLFESWRPRQLPSRSLRIAKFLEKVLEFCSSTFGDHGASDPPGTPDRTGASGRIPPRQNFRVLNLLLVVSPQRSPSAGSRSVSGVSCAVLIRTVSVDPARASVRYIRSVVAIIASLERTPLVVGWFAADGGDGSDDFCRHCEARSGCRAMSSSWRRFDCDEITCAGAGEAPERASQQQRQSV